MLKYAPTVLLVLTLKQALAQTVCVSNRPVTGAIAGDVTFRAGVNCIISNAQVAGSVKCDPSPCPNAKITIRTNSVVSGSVEGEGLNRVQVTKSTIEGDLKVSSVGTGGVIISADSAVSAAEVLGASGAVTVGGTIGKLLCGECGALTVNAATFANSLEAEFGTGLLKICGSTFAKGLSVKDRSGGVTIGGSGCAVSTFSDQLKFEKGTGNIAVTGADLASGGISVSEYSGNVNLLNMELGGVEIKTVAAVRLSQVTAGGIKVSGATGHVQVLNSDVSEGIEVEGITTPKTTIQNIDYVGASSGKISVGSGGDTKIANVQNFNLGVETSGPGVAISGSTLVEVELVENTGPVVLTNNVIELIACADNNPAPTGSGNTITGEPVDPTEPPETTEPPQPGEQCANLQ